MNSVNLVRFDWLGATDCGFTLMGLLGVIAIIAFLAAMLPPARSGTKMKGQRIRCLNKHQQLALASTVQAADFNESFTAPFGLPIESRHWPRWVIGWRKRSAN